MENDNFMFLEGSEYGSISGEQLEELSKALLAPNSADDMYGTTQTSGGAGAIQSLEGMYVDLTLNVNDFTLWQDLNKIKAFQTVEEYDQYLGHGINDGGFVGQMENPEFRDPDIKKQLAYVKFMSEGWQVGDVFEATRNLADRTRMQRSAMIRLLRNLNLALYNGDSTMIPKSFDGMSKAISGESTDQTKDMRGASVSMSTFNLLAQLVTEGNGNVENSRLYSSPAGLQNLGNIIETGATSTGDRKIVEMGKDGITIGGKIKSIMTTFGEMIVRMDKLLGLAYESKCVPQYYDQATSTWIEGSTSDKAPSIPTIALTNQAGTTGSIWSDSATVRPSAIKYNYRVVARNCYGRSVASVAVESTSVVTAAGSILITITPNPADSGSKLPSCFEIYSEKVGGSGVYRYMATVAANTAPLTAVTYTDINTYIPGTARMFIVDQSSMGEQRVIAFSQLLPVHNTDLGKFGRYSQGLINLYGTPKYYKPNVLCEIRNIGIEQSNANLYNTI